MEREIKRERERYVRTRGLSDLSAALLPYDAVTFAFSNIYFYYYFT